MLLLLLLGVGLQLLDDYHQRGHFLSDPIKVFLLAVLGDGINDPIFGIKSKFRITCAIFKLGKRDFRIKLLD